MDLFDKATKVAKNMGDTAKTVGNSIYSSTKEQSELAGLNIQLSVIHKKLESEYAEIGKRYVDYVRECDADKTFEVEDIIEKIEPELEKLSEIQEKISQIEEQMHKNNEEKEKKKAQDAFQAEKAKLDKAMGMDIITESEYEEKLAQAQKKLDNYDMLRKIELQYQMDIITEEEYIEKKKKCLGM